MTGLFDMASIGLLLQRREQNRHGATAPVGLDREDFMAARDRSRKNHSSGYEKK
jgi:hypothetical protein